MITLVALLCHLSTAVPVPLCEETVIPTVDKNGNSLLAAGKVDDPQTMPWNERVCKEQAQWLLAEYLQTNEAHHGWWPTKYGCVKDYVPLQKASLEQQRAALVHKKKVPPVKNFDEAYKALHDQQGDKKLPHWCAVSTDGGREVDDPEDKGVGLDNHCVVRRL